MDWCTDLVEQRLQIHDLTLDSGCMKDYLEHISAVPEMQIYCSCCLHLVLQNESVSGALFPLQFFDLFLYLEGMRNFSFSIDH